MQPPRGSRATFSWEIPVCGECLRAKKTGHFSAKQPCLPIIHHVFGPPLTKEQKCTRRESSQERGREIKDRLPQQPCKNSARRPLVVLRGRRAWWLKWVVV